MKPTKKTSFQSPGPGIYCFELRADEAIILSTRLNVIKVTPRRTIQPCSMKFRMILIDHNRIRYNLAIAAQRLPEMTDEEVIIANHGKGGFDWLNDPAEDAY